MRHTQRVRKKLFDVADIMRSFHSPPFLSCLHVALLLNLYLFASSLKIPNVIEMQRHKKNGNVMCLM